jgi:DNA-binding transcriptional regulator YiaG
MKNKYESELLQVIHEDMKGMHRLGIISDARMREFDKMCLIQEPETAHPTENPLKMTTDHAPRSEAFSQQT